MQTAKCIQTKLMRTALKVKIYRNECIGEFYEEKKIIITQKYK